MVEIIWTLIFMIIIGAIIGGVTNSLAIKMLFRPYKPIYLGKYRLPFTPGLIPKRRDELAEQLGQMVVNHLLTAEGLQKKLKEPLFLQEMEAWLKAEAHRLLESNQSLSQAAQANFGMDDLASKSETKIERFIEQRLQLMLEEVRDSTLEDVLSDGALLKIEGKLPALAETIADKVALYLESDQGKESIETLIDTFLSGRGMLGNMISMFLGNESLVDKVQREVSKLLRQRTTIVASERLLNTEWTKLKQMNIRDLEKHFDTEAFIDQFKAEVIKQLPLNELLHKPISVVAAPYKDVLVNVLVPNVMELAVNGLSERLNMLMKKLHLAQIVKSQVETFSVAHLEDIVLSISRREFKMITYLGALLGGMIGCIQGVIIFILRG
jgi:uncharacterized membrane protein YheB (UPF0754 family)